MMHLLSRTSSVSNYIYIAHYQFTMMSESYTAHDHALLSRSPPGTDSLLTAEDDLQLTCQVFSPPLVL